MNNAISKQMVCKKDYDIVFMDHMMPLMDGVEARELFVSNGFSDFVAKPIKLKELCACIRNWLPEELVHTENIEGFEINENPVDTDGDTMDIEGLDVKEGILNSGSKELFLSLLGDFYKLIDQKSTKVEKCLADGMIRDYTIEVHALKSTACMIGAMELSEKFYRLEQLGNTENEKSLALETPNVLSLYRSYKPILEPFACKNDQERQEISVDERIRHHA